MMMWNPPWISLLKYNNRNFRVACRDEYAMSTKAAPIMKHDPRGNNNNKSFKIGWKCCLCWAGSEYEDWRIARHYWRISCSHDQGRCDGICWNSAHSAADQQSQGGINFFWKSLLKKLYNVLISTSSIFSVNVSDQKVFSVYKKKRNFAFLPFFKKLPTLPAFFPLKHFFVCLFLSVFSSSILRKKKLGVRDIVIFFKNKNENTDLFFEKRTPYIFAQRPEIISKKLGVSKKKG